MESDAAHACGEGFDPLIDFYLISLVKFNRFSRIVPQNFKT